MTLTTLALILAGIGGAAGIGSGIGGTVAHNRQRDAVIQRLMGQGMSRADAEYVAQQYDKGTFNLFDPTTWANRGYDEKAMQDSWNEYQKIKSQLGEMPKAPDDEAILKEAQERIQKENADVIALYDQMLGRSKDAYARELDINNQAYNDYRNQVLANNAQSLNMVQGGIRSEMDRQQRVAITRGASAAQRLVANINAQMNTQNKASQQALDTSNNLANALLQQRQAASGIRQNYTNSLNQDTNRRAELLRGSSERTTNYQNSLRNQAYDTYNNRMDKWNDQLASYGDNPYVDVYRRQQIRNGL